MSAHNVLWNGIKDGDSGALEKLYRKYFKDLYNYGKRMSRNTELVEDAIQETFMNIWNYRKNITIPDSEKAYLLRSYRNQLMQQMRNHSIIVHSDENENLYFDFEISFEQKLIEGEDARSLSAKVNDALKQLTPRQKEIVYYRFFEGLSFEDIGGIMDMQTRATYKLASRAIHALRQILGNSMFGLLLFFN